MTVKRRLFNGSTAAGVVALGIAFCPAPLALAQDSTMSKADSAKSKGMSMKASADQKFAMEAAQGGMAEVELGKLAAQKGSSDGVKKFGQKMVDDHSAANDKLKAIAAKKNMTLPSDMTAKDKAEMQRLQNMSGAAFDKSYTAYMLKDHQTDVAAFQKESSMGKDADIKAFATETLPTLQEHLKMVQGMSTGSMKSMK